MNPLDKTNLWLLLSVTALAWIAWTRPGIHQPNHPILSTLDPAQIREINLYHNGRIKFSLTYTSSGWQMTKPFSAQADSARVIKLTQLTTLPSLRQFEVPEPRLHEFGLANPQYHLQLNELDFYFGTNDPLTKQRYVLANNKVHVIPDSYTAYLMVKPREYLLDPDA